MHKKIFFLGATLFFCSSVLGADKSQANVDLLSAAQNGDSSLLEDAIKRGGDVNHLFEVENKFMTTALHEVISRKNKGYHKDKRFSTIKVLIENKANVNLQNSICTPLELHFDHPEPTIIDCLLKSKADPSIPNELSTVLTRWSQYLYKDNAFKHTVLETFLSNGWLHIHTPLPLAIQHVQLHLLSFIPVKPVADIVVSYLVEKETDHA